MTWGDVPGPAKEQVVLQAPAFIKGWLITTTLWVGLLATIIAISHVVTAFRSGTDAWTGWGVVPLALFYGYGTALLAGAPLAWVLAFLLRPVRRQWIHVGAFFAAPTLVFWGLGGLLGLGWHPGLLGLWATVGAAAAVGRWAIRGNISTSSAWAAREQYPEIPAR
ncbi:hypothetical protein ACRB8A_01810 [Arthrobacter sp. G.S.26]|uniref:hypothetical protein n=1 Tax=Arthrobacter sp. G.S.26 TaxID=3433706 RepID=UPI003D789DA6